MNYNWPPYLWISLGAILGANLRYLVSRWLAHWLGVGFPYGTLMVNLLGCFGIGVVGTLVMSRLVGRADVIQPAVMVGFLGSLTTFSSFSWETYNLFIDGAWPRALGNVLLSVTGGLVAAMLGIYLVTRLGGPS